MYIGDYLKAAEGRTWTAEDSREVDRVLREVEAVHIAARNALMRDREPGVLTAEMERLHT